MDIENNCAYCTKNNGREKFPNLELIKCGVRATYVLGNGSDAKNCIYFPKYDRRRDQNE
jgi:hypothetical protein